MKESRRRKGIWPAVLIAACLHVPEPAHGDGVLVAFRSPLINDVSREKLDRHQFEAKARAWAIKLKLAPQVFAPSLRDYSATRKNGFLASIRKYSILILNGHGSPEGGLVLGAEVDSTGRNAVWNHIQYQLNLPTRYDDSPLSGLAKSEIDLRVSPREGAPLDPDSALYAIGLTPTAIGRQLSMAEASSPGLVVLAMCYSSSLGCKLPNGKVVKHGQSRRRLSILCTPGLVSMSGVMNQMEQLFASLATTPNSPDSVAACLAEQYPLSLAECSTQKNPRRSRQKIH